MAGYVETLTLAFVLKLYIFSLVFETRVTVRVSFRFQCARARACVCVCVRVLEESFVSYISLLFVKSNGSGEFSSISLLLSH